jgi:hypothetical protein
VPGHDQPAAKHQQGPCHKISALQQVTVEKRALVRGYRVHGEKIEAEPGERCLDPGLVRIEPVFQLAPVEHQLQRADPQAQGQEADEVEWLATHVAGLTDEDQDAERAQHADR